MLLVLSSLVLSVILSLSFLYNKYAFVLLLAAFYSIFLLTVIKDKIIYIVIILSFTIDYVVYLLKLPAYFTYFLHLNIFVYVTYVLFHLKTRTLLMKNNPLMILWIVYMLVIGLLNSSISILTVQRLIVYFLYPFLFLATIHRDEPQTHEQVKLSFLMFFVAIQVPVTMVQKAIFWNWSSTIRGQMAVDRVGGTLGWAGTHFIAVLMGMAFCYCLAKWLHKRTIRNFVAMLIPFIPMALGNANAGFAFAFLGGLVVIGVFSFDPIQPMLKKVTGLFGLVIPILLAYALLANLLPKLDPNFDKSSWKLFTSSSYFIKYTTGYARGNGMNTEGPARRLEQINFVNNVTTNKWFGSGIGILSYSSLLGIGPRSSFLTQSLLWATALTRHLLETGMIGTVIYILVLLSFIPPSIYVLYRKLPVGRERIFLTSFPAVVIIFVSSSIYTDAWKFPATACVFWLCSARVWKGFQRSQQNR